MSSDYGCRRTTTFDVNSKRFHLSIPQPKIKFSFFLQSDYVNILQGQEFVTLPSKKHSASAVVAVEEGSEALFEDMVEAFVEAIGNRLVEDDLKDLIDLAWEKVSRIFPAKTLAKWSVLYLRFDVRIKHRHTFVGCRSEVPAACSLAALYEDEGVEKEEEDRCCCICLEEIGGSGGGGGALRMPCLHLFHGGCIKAWLRKSNCCPLCRYEIPSKN